MLEALIIGKRQHDRIRFVFFTLRLQKQGLLDLWIDLAGRQQFIDLGCLALAMSRFAPVIDAELRQLDMVSALGRRTRRRRRPQTLSPPEPEHAPSVTPASHYRPLRFEPNQLCRAEKPEMSATVARLRKCVLLQRTAPTG